MAEAPALPPPLAVAVGFKTLADAETGEILSREKARNVLALNLHDIVSVAFPKNKFTILMKSTGELATIRGAACVAKQSETCYPGSTTWSEILEAENAMRDAGLPANRLSPAGRALALAIKHKPLLAGWRLPARFMAAFSDALFGGVQLGGVEKPDMTQPAGVHARTGRPLGWYYADVVSSYPYLATWELPTVPSAIFERGYSPHATLWRLSCTQEGPRLPLWQRTGPGRPPEHMPEVSGWYVAEEIDYLASTEKIRNVEIVESVRFPLADKYLAPTIEHLAPFKDRETFEPRRAALKSAMNGLVGKFAARLSPWRPPRAGESLKGKVSTQLGANVLLFDGQMANVFPASSNVVFTALTTARARVRLWQKIDEIERAGGDVVWAHTDAVVARVPDDYSPTDAGNTLGQWRTLARTLSHEGSLNGNRQATEGRAG